MPKAVDEEERQTSDSTINVTSAVASGGATGERIPGENVLNTTGRKAEMDYLFSEAGLHIVRVQERTLPQTPRSFRRMTTQFSTLELHLGNTTVACSFGSRNDTQKP